MSNIFFADGRSFSYIDGDWEWVDLPVPVIIFPDRTYLSVGCMNRTSIPMIWDTRKVDMPNTEHDLYMQMYKKEPYNNILPINTEAMHIYSILNYGRDEHVFPFHGPVLIASKEWRTTKINKNIALF